MADDGDAQHLYSDLDSDFSDYLVNSASDQENDSDNDGDLGDNRNTDSKLKRFLVWWAIKHAVPRTHVTSLLQGLKEHVEVAHNIDLGIPSDYRSLLRTPRDISHMITETDSGRFATFGIKRGLQRLVSQGLNLEGVNEVKIATFLDGFNPYKKGKSFWALLHKVHGLNSKRVFMSGLYVGEEQPQNFNNLLRNFVDEFNELKSVPFNLVGVTHKILLKSGGPFVCDFPAKAHAKGTKPSGYEACDFCEVFGVSDHSIVYPELLSEPRTNVKFRDHMYFTVKGHQKHVTVLEEIEDMDMVLDFPHDHLHLVLLGTVRRFMSIQFVDPGKHKLLPKAIEQAAQDFRNLVESITLEFQWKPRKLTKVKQFKGKEYRYLLLYAGLVVLKDVLPPVNYENFVGLSCAYRILSSPELVQNEVDLNRASTMLRNFVLFVRSTLGREHCVRVVHGLLHLVDDCRRFKCLNEFSAFPFESFLSSMKFLIRSRNMELEQVIKRYSEQEFGDIFWQPESLENREGHLGKAHNLGPTMGIDCTQYKSIITKEYKITTTFPNNILLLRNEDERVKAGHVVVVDNIVKRQDNSALYFVTREFNQLDDLFVNPLRSSTLNIVVATGSPNPTRRLHSISLLEKKCIMFKRSNNKNVIIPLVH